MVDSSAATASPQGKATSEPTGAAKRVKRHSPEPWEVRDTYDADDPIAQAVEKYFYSVMGLRDSFGVLASKAEIDAEEALADWQGFVESIDRSEEDHRRRLGARRFPFDAPPVKQPVYLAMLRRHLVSASLSESMAHMMHLVLIARYDAFLADLLRATFKKKPELLRRSERSISWADVADLSDKNAIRALIIEREVDAFLHKGHIEQLDDLASRLAIETLKKFDELPQFVEITERRNLLAHTGGRVSLQYLRQCQRYGIRPEVKPGDEINVTYEYFTDACNTMLVIGVKLAQILWRVILGKNRDSLSAPDNYLAQVTYTLLAYEEWELAQVMLKFATELRQFSSDQRELVFTVNLAQTFKWLGNMSACRRILEPVEWESKDIAFQISHAVLLDDFDSAGELMNTAASTRQVARSAFDHWPIYREFRKTTQFREAYEQTFGEWTDPGEALINYRRKGRS